jgi:hypothetical protein
MSRIPIRGRISLVAKCNDGVQAGSA